MTRKGRNKYGAAGKRGIPGPTVAAFFDQYTHTPGHGSSQKIINGHIVDPNQNRTIRRWRSGGAAANRDAVRRMLWDLGFSWDYFERWLDERNST